MMVSSLDDTHNSHRLNVGFDEVVPTSKTKKNVISYGENNYVKKISLGRFFLDSLIALSPANRNDYLRTVLVGEM